LSTRLELVTKTDLKESGEDPLDRLLNYMYGPDLPILPMKLLYIESQMMTVALKIGYLHHTLDNKNKKGDP
jgi:hypothetical protein